MISINGLNLSDNVNYLVEEVSYRGTPDRDIISQPISTRPGDKLITTEWREKTITIKGRIFSPTASGIQPYIDALQQNMAVQSAPLIIDTGRTYTVSLKKLDIPTQFFNTAMVEYTATMQAIDPFAYGSLLTVSGLTLSGILTFSGSVTISGTVFAEPVITITPTTAGLLAGHSGINTMQTIYTTTGEILTFSGMNSGDFLYGVPIGLDYKNFLVTISGISTDYSGVFSRWEPGVRQFTISVTSGLHNGYTWALAYQPRYLE